MQTQEQRARSYAQAAHAARHQRRKYTNEPYIVHPAAVVELVRSVSEGDETMLAAAWLHDTVEDTQSTLADITARFGPEVASLVAMITNPSFPEALNRTQRKAFTFAHTARANARAQTIKLADIIDNTRGIIRYDPDFARLYLLEKRLQLAGLTQGNKELREQANFIIESGIARLMQPPYNVTAAWFIQKAQAYQPQA